MGQYSYFWFYMSMVSYFPSNDGGLLHESVGLRNMCKDLEVRDMDEVPYVIEIDIL